MRADHRIISPLHLRILAIVAELDRADPQPALRLEGGTALAAWFLHHRESEDLDLFADPGFNASDFARRLATRCAAEGLRVDGSGPSTIGFARLLVRDPAHLTDAPVRVDLAVASSSRLEPLLDTDEGVRLASWRDLCAGKLHAICDRFEPRDFVDLHFIVSERVDPHEQRRVSLRGLVDDLLRTDPGLAPHHLGQALQRGLGQPLVERMPLRLLRPVTDAAVHESARSMIAECARRVREAMAVYASAGAGGSGSRGARPSGGSAGAGSSG
jgi:hypothetical protein